MRPTATLGNYKGVEVGKREAAADEEAVEGELDALRERSARLETVDEPAGENDFIVMDYLGTIDGDAFEGGEGRDQLIELGSGRLVPGFEEQLTGAKAGDERTVKITFPDDYGADELEGRDAEFEVTVNEVKRKELPELDDDFASDAAGFDTLDELREDIAAKLREADENRLEAEFREAVLDAVVADAKVEVPETLVDARARELWDRMLHSLGHQGITSENYLQIAGQGRGRDHRRGAARRRAGAAPRGRDRRRHRGRGDRRRPTATSSTRCRPRPPARARRPRSSASASRRRAASTSSSEDLAQRAAVDLLAENARALTVEQARARDKLWTPDKEYPQGLEKPLWTPGS